MNSTPTPLALAVGIRDAVHFIKCDAIREHGRIYLSNCRLVWRGVERALAVTSLREVNCDAVFEAAREALSA